MDNNLAVMQDEQQDGADAHSTFMNTFVRRGVRRNCFFAPNKQEFLAKLNLVVNNQNSMEDES